MRVAVGPVVGLAMFLSGCGASRLTTSAPALPALSSVTPSAAGTPNSVAMLGSYEFISVQGTGQIFTYDLSSGLQTLAVPPYSTACNDPSGMVTASIGSSNVMAVVCYDANSLLMLSIHADGSLSALGSVLLPGTVYPGTVLDGTNVVVPLFGKNHVANGGVAKVSIANPASPVLTGFATLASPVPGGFANPGYLTVANGKIFVAAGSESAPLATSSTIQVVDEATMTLLGAPMAVEHSPQQIAVAGTTAYTTIFDATELVSIDVSNPASMKVLQTLPLTATGAGGVVCHALPVAIRNGLAYVGCYYEGIVEVLLVSDPANMRRVGAVTDISYPQRLMFTATGAMVVPSSAVGGSVYLAQPGLFGVE